MIVRGLLTWLSRAGAGKAGKREADALYEGLPTLPPTARLALVEQRDLEPLIYGRQRSNRFVQLAQQEASGFTQGLPLATEPRRLDFSGGRKESMRRKLSRSAAQALADVTRGDLRRVDNELLKLASYVDGARAINEEDVALLAPWVAEARTFDFTDALAERRVRPAQELLQQMLAEDTSSDGPHPLRYGRDAFSASAADARAHAAQWLGAGPGGGAGRPARQIPEQAAAAVAEVLAARPGTDFPRVAGG